MRQRERGGRQLGNPCGCHTTVDRASFRPETADLALSVEGHVSPGGTRHYQGHHRNPVASCTPATANDTNAVQIDGAP